MRLPLFLLGLVCLLFAVMAFADDAPPVAVPVPSVAIATAAPVAPGVTMPGQGQEISWAKDAITWIWGKWRARAYGPAIGALIMFLLALSNLILLRFTSKVIQSELMPHLAMVVAVGSAVALKLLALEVGASPLAWLTAIGYGLMLGLTAIGAWEYLGKKLLGKYLDKLRTAKAG